MRLSEKCVLLAWQCIEYIVLLFNLVVVVVKKSNVLLLRFVSVCVVDTHSFDRAYTGNIVVLRNDSVML